MDLDLLMKGRLETEPPQNTTRAKTSLLIKKLAIMQVELPRIAKIEEEEWA